MVNAKVIEQALISCYYNYSPLAITFEDEGNPFLFILKNLDLFSYLFCYPGLITFFKVVMGPG